MPFYFVTTENNGVVTGKLVEQDTIEGAFSTGSGGLGDRGTVVTLVAAPTILQKDPGVPGVIAEFSWTANSTLVSTTAG
jgi:hypothetical protein